MNLEKRSFVPIAIVLCVLTLSTVCQGQNEQKLSKIPVQFIGRWIEYSKGVPGDVLSIEQEKIVWRRVGPSWKGESILKVDDIQFWGGALHFSTAGENETKQGDWTVTSKGTIFVDVYFETGKLKVETAFPEATALGPIVGGTAPAMVGQTTSTYWYEKAK